jgi:hypothetical protein
MEDGAHGHIRLARRRNEARVRTEETDTTRRCKRKGGAIMRMRVICTLRMMSMITMMMIIKICGCGSDHNAWK